MLWATWHGKELPGLMVEDVLAYKAFLADPQPVDLWCLQTQPRTMPDGSPNPLCRQVRRVTRVLADGSPNPTWRPFVSGLSASAIKQATTILFGLFEHLAAIGYVHANPLRAAAKRTRKTRRQGQERYFDAAAWATLKDWIEVMPKEDCAGGGALPPHPLPVFFPLPDRPAAFRDGQGTHVRSSFQTGPMVA
jgi:integrase/recombinase XerD